MRGGYTKPDFEESRLSEPAPTSRYTEHTEATKLECYQKCVGDSWELESEFVCASACGLD